ncbi:MAG: VWA domain-containing protein [Chloroflexi bacterium]|nr:VWA domain-containing protein [Chloroflexota bacterium]
MQADYVLDYDVVSVSDAQDVFLMARIKAGGSSKPVKRRPLNLSVVLDRSGSMSGEKIDYVRKAAQFLVQHLGQNDRFSLVTYDHNVAVDVEPGPVVHKDHIRHVIDKITPGGSTNLSGGWLQGVQLVSKEQAEGQVNRTLLLTDGLANQGVTDPRRLAAMARQKREEGITTTTMGVGLGFNEDLLKEMATEGGGAFYFIDNPDQTPQIFAEELQDLLNVVGQNLQITLIPSPDVQMVRQLNAYPKDGTREGHVFRLGDIYADELKTMVLQMHIPALEKLGEVEVARLRFEYDELQGDRVNHQSLELPIKVHVKAANELADREPNREVLKAALLLEAARSREEAIRHADEGEFDTATGVLSAMADRIRESGILDDKELQTEHDILREEAVDMEMGESRYDNQTRKMSKTRIFQSARSQHYYASKVNSHIRHKRSREAVERGGDTPGRLIWLDQSLDLTAEKLVIGRSRSADIQLDDEEVSGQHAQIVREADDLYLEDLASTNGTFANGGALNQRFRLSVGDVFTVGSVLFMCQPKTEEQAKSESKENQDG